MWIDEALFLSHPLVVELSLAELKTIVEVIAFKKNKRKHESLLHKLWKGCRVIFKSVITSFKAVVDFIKRNPINEPFRTKKN